MQERIKESPPIPPPEPLKAASRSSRSLLSRSEISLAAAPAASATGGPAVLPDVCCGKEIEKRRLHYSSANSSAFLVRSLPRVGPGSFPVSSKAVVQRVFCWLSLRAVLEQMLTSLNLILAPPTAGVQASSSPRKVLSCQAEPRLKIKTR